MPTLLFGANWGVKAVEQMYAKLNGIEKDVVVATVFQLNTIYGFRMAYQQPTYKQWHAKIFSNNLSKVSQEMIGSLNCRK